MCLDFRAHYTVWQELITDNPAEKVKLLKVDYNKRDCLTDDEVKALFPENDDDFMKIWKNFSVGALCYFLLTTGMRHGEARALKWSDINFADKVVNITKSVKNNGSIGTTKNGRSRLSIISPRTALMLNKLRDSSDFASDNDFIFTVNGKNPFWDTHTNKYFSQALKRANIPTDKNIVIHSLRHTFVTMCIKKNGMPGRQYCIP